MRAELLNLVNNRPQQSLRRQITILPYGFNQALLSEFFSFGTEGFGNAVCIERQCISGEEKAFPYRAVPFLEESQYRGRRIELFNAVVAAQQQSGEMPAIRVTQAAQPIVILSKEKSGLGCVGRILVEELIHRSQKELRLIQSHGALAAQVRLQIRHQKSSSDSFS